MNVVEKTIWHIDALQRKYSFTAFLYAVIKKYGDDQAGYQAALVTYYGFLSLFPLLLVVTTIAGIAGQHDPALGRRLVSSTSSYFPVVGQSLDKSVHGLSKSGPALIIGIIFTFYGARGIADAFIHAANQLWQVPKSQLPGFPKSLINSFTLVLGGGGGFLLAAITAGFAAAAGHGLLFRLLSVAINLGLLYGVFTLILHISLPTSMPRQKFQVGAAISAIGITTLQIVGGFIIKHESKSLTNSYSALFATTLGLLAWIYLQVQVIMYAIEVDTVRDRKLWPRSLSGKQPTAADKLLTH